MIKARYIGAECELQSGKVYPIKTRCTGNKLVVSVRVYKFEYNSLEYIWSLWAIAIRISPRKREDFISILSSSK